MGLLVKRSGILEYRYISLYTHRLGLKIFGNVHIAGLWCMLAELLATLACVAYSSREELTSVPAAYRGPTTEHIIPTPYLPCTKSYPTSYQP